MANKRYNSVNDWLKKKFGGKIYKVSLESGCPCPNMDGTVGVGGCIFCNTESLRPATDLHLTRRETRDVRRELGCCKDSDLGDRGSCLNIPSQLAIGIAYMKSRHRAEKFIAYFQNRSNTHAPTEHLRQIFGEALSHPEVVGLSVSTRPDCIDENHAELFRALSASKFVWVELGLQSAHDATLKLINRGHSAADFTRAINILNAAKIPVCAHIILGLPNETPGMMIETARFLNAAGVWGVKIHNLHVLRGTVLENLYNEGKVEIPSLKTYANWVVDFLEELNPKIIIHRVNSHSPRNLTVAPEWSVNKLAIFNEVELQMRKRGTWQGKHHSPLPSARIL